jgi:hypothetical protein
MEPELVARRAGEGLQYTLRRLASLVGGLVLLTAAISLATFATGWWVFGGSTAWIVIGGFVCLAPVAAATVGWLFVHAAAKFAPRLISDVALFLKKPSPAASVLIDYDTGQPIVMSSRQFGGLREELSSRKTDLPALWVGVRAITLVPALAAVTFIGMLVVGALGTILLIGGLIN